MQRNKARVYWIKSMGAASIILMSLGISSLAQAIPVTFQFTGTVSGLVNPILNPPVLPNTAISGSYTFESTAPDLLGGSPLIARYALSTFSLDVLGRHYTNSSSGIQVIHVQPGVPIATGTTDDQYSVLLLANTFLNPTVLGPSINNLAPQGFQLNIFGQDLFASDALPLVPPSLGNIAPARRTFNMTFQAGGFTGELTSLTVASVPEPDTLLLFGFGLIGLAGLRILRRWSPTQDCGGDVV